MKIREELLKTTETLDANIVVVKDTADLFVSFNIQTRSLIILQNKMNNWDDDSWYYLTPTIKTNVTEVKVDIISYFRIFSGANYSEFLIEMDSDCDELEDLCSILKADDFLTIFTHYLKTELGIEKVSVEKKQYGSKGQECFAEIIKIKQGADAAFFNLSFNEKIKPCRESELYYRGKKLRERIFK